MSEKYSTYVNIAHLWQNPMHVLKGKMKVRDSIPFSSQDRSANTTQLPSSILNWLALWPLLTWGAEGGETGSGRKTGTEAGDRGLRGKRKNRRNEHSSSGYEASSKSD